MARVTVDRLKKLFLAGIDARYAPAFEEIAGSIGALIERVAKLEKEQAEFISGEWHRGVWDDRPYKKGHAVTHQGSMWIAREDTSAKPGTDPAWQLVVKRGRDGRDRGV